MSSYVGRHAELYDFFYKDKPYKAEATFVHECLQRHGRGIRQRVLDLACGTGTHAFELEQLGYQVVGVDYSADMLHRAVQKGRDRNSGVLFHLGDMRELNLDEPLFDAAICLFDAIGYTCTNDGVGRVLQTVRRHVRPGGLFVFEFWYAAAMLRHYDPVRVRRWCVARGEILRISQTSLDYEQQTATVQYDIYELGDDGRYSHFSEAQANRYFLVQDMAQWLQANGFQPLKWFAGYDTEARITDSTWHILCVARRSD